MLLKSDKLSELIKSDEPDTITVVPHSDLVKLPAGGASIDLRLGRWFTTLRPMKVPILDVSKATDAPHNEGAMTKQHYVPFGERFYLHPGKFVLGVTLEWIRVPSFLGGFVGGKSSWGRRGLIIETAAGIHPGFSGCLTLEITNLGEVPIAIVPGMPICQVVFHRTEGGAARSESAFGGRRKPTIGQIRTDLILEKLSKPLP